MSALNGKEKLGERFGSNCHLIDFTHAVGVIRLGDAISEVRYLQHQVRSRSCGLRRKWLPTLDTLRNFFLLSTTEMLTVFQPVREVVW